MKRFKRHCTRQFRRFDIERLESKQLLAANPVISEFLARNDGGLRDGDGRASDWIEIYNAGDQSVDLAGYRLTDKPDNLTKWTFPSVSLEPGAYLVVFASGQDADDYVDVQNNLHTNFTLNRGGEYLALISPSGQTLSEFGSAEEDFPEQLTNISYGFAQSSDLITTESTTQYWVPSTGAVDDQWFLPAFDAAANGFTEGASSIGFEEQPTARNNFVGLFQTEVPSTAHAVYARYDFTIGTASEITGLQLDMQYDDGFIAYLNGQRILSENADEVATSFSTATDNRNDRDVLVPTSYDLSSSTNLLVDGNNVLAIHGLNHLSDRRDFLIATTLRAASAGPRLADGTEARIGYMTTPTPGMPNVGNSEVADGFVADTKFSQDRGFYDEPFTVEITTDVVEARIKYTLDGSTPTESNGTLYAGPINITTTTTLRAAAFIPGFLPGDVDTHTYIFLDDVLKQPADPPGFPPRWGNAGPADYAMDARVTTDTSSPYYSPLVRDALLTHPTISIVTDNEFLFDSRIGIYSNPQSDGVAWERPASMEYFDPNTDREIQLNAGLRIQGGASRNPNRPKHNMRFLFKGDYGPTKLNFPLFETTEVDQFDTFILRGQNGDSWFHPQVNSRDPQYIRDQWLRETQREMGRPTPAQDHAHVYINGLYWGFYNTIEKPNASYFAEHFGGEKEGYDVLQHQGGTVDGTRDVWNQMMAIARGGVQTDEDYQAIQQYVDMDGMIDYLLINFYAGNVDWDQNNWFGGRRRTEDGRFIFFTWDAERTFLNINENVTTKNVANQPTQLHQWLTQHEEYRVRFADAVHRHFFNDGALTPDQVEARWMRWADEIELALWAESARFGDAKRNAPYTPDVQWLTDLNKFREDYFPRRTDVVLNQLRSRDLYPDVAAPQFNQQGGTVTEGFELTAVAPEGVLYYTTDGTDPRLPGGAVSPTAAIYSGPVTPTDGIAVKARVLHDGQWSALNEALFEIASTFPLRITELNYKPYTDSQGSSPEPPLDGDRFEFIELVNVGTRTVDLNGVQLEQQVLNGRRQGIRFQFAAQMLSPGQRTIVVRDREAFTQRYGENQFIAAGADGEDGVQGQYGGNLENRGEQITLSDSQGRLIQQFSYGFSGDWPARANGRGSSLEIINAQGNPGDPANWQSSLDFGGSPGTAGSSARSLVAFNELLASPAEGSDLIELRNLTGADIDVGGWYLTDSEDDYLRYRLPDSTLIAESGFVTLEATQLGLDLDASRGGVLQLVEADAGGRPSRFVDRITFGPSLPGVSLGPSSTDPIQWVALDRVTFGEPNSGPFVSDVVVTEIQYNPADLDGDGRGSSITDFQFVELTNHGDQARDVSGWRVDGDIQYTFPDSTVIQAGESVSIVRFRPTDVGKVSVFRFTMGMPPDARVFGRFRGSLSSEQGSVQLIRPLDPSDRDSREVVLERIDYQATAPWPDVSPIGISINRTRPQDLPQLPISWIAADPSPGSFDEVARVIGDSNHDGVFDRLDLTTALQGGKYQTGLPARWEDGDWDGDGDFDQRDLVFALQSNPF